jgi:2Fe-2S type ferredoxin
MSMARHAMLAEPTRPVTLLYSARSWDGLAFRDEIQIAARRHPHFKAFFAVTGDTDRADVYPGRIDAALVKTAAPEIAHAIVLMCGPQAMIDGLREALPGLGVTPAQIRFEVFQAAVAAAAGSAASPPRRVNGAAHRMTCARSGHELTIEPPQTVLDAAEAAGVDIPTLCRAGVCGTCRTKVLDGHVDCSSDVLDDEDRREGYVLACVATPLSDCTVDA